jgi:hypothetical protein
MLVSCFAYTSTTMKIELTCENLRFHMYLISFSERGEAGLHVHDAVNVARVCWNCTQETRSLLRGKWVQAFLSKTLNL